MSPVRIAMLLPHGVGGGYSAAAVGSVHDVVVVQRAEVRDLERLGHVDDLGGVAVAELCGEEREHGTDPLAAGLVQVAAGGVGQWIGDADVVCQSGLDELQPVFDGARDTSGGRTDEDAIAEAETARQSRTRGDGARSHVPSLPSSDVTVSPGRFTPACALCAGPRCRR